MINSPDSQDHSVGEEEEDEGKMNGSMYNYDKLRAIVEAVSSFRPVNIYRPSSEVCHFHIRVRELCHFLRA